MLMTTILVSKFLAKRKFPPYVIGIFLTVYLLIELTFLSGNLVKFVTWRLVYLIGWCCVVLDHVDMAHCPEDQEPLYEVYRY